MNRINAENNYSTSKFIVIHSQQRATSLKSQVNMVGTPFLKCLDFLLQRSDGMVIKAVTTILHIEGKTMSAEYLDK